MAEVQRLSNSLLHLSRSNNELLEFLSEDTEMTTGERSEFATSVDENLVTIATQKERLEMIRLVLQEQLGVDAANSHYDVVPRAVVIEQVIQRENVSTGPTGSMEELEQLEDDGMHL